jgi:hypothetical protein
MTEDLPVLLRGIYESFILLSEQGLDEVAIVAQCPFPELYVGLPCDVTFLTESILDCAVLLQQQRLVPRIPVIEAYAALMQTLVSKVSMADGSLGQYQPSAFVIDGLANVDTFDLVSSLFVRVCEEQKHLVRIPAKSSQYFHQAKTKWAYIAMCPQIGVNNRLRELQSVRSDDFEGALERLCENLEAESWKKCAPRCHGDTIAMELSSPHQLLPSDRVNAASLPHQPPPSEPVTAASSPHQPPPSEPVTAPSSPHQPPPSEHVTAPSSPHQPPPSELVTAPSSPRGMLDTCFV